jgi:hypothetical protein
MLLTGQSRRCSFPPGKWDSLISVKAPLSYRFEKPKQLPKQYYGLEKPGAKRYPNFSSAFFGI